MANEFTPQVGSAVDKDEAMKWIEKYDKEMRKNKDTDTRSVFYGRELIEKILSQDGCTGISFFPALKYNDHAKKDTVQLVLIGTRLDGSLIMPESSTGKGDGGGTVGDSGLNCPPVCPTAP